MAFYNEKKLVNYALGLTGRWIITAFIYAIIGAAIAVVVQEFHTQNLGILDLFDLAKIQQSNQNQMGVFAVIGFSLGAVNGWRDRAVSQLMLCHVEQEKHLRAIAEGMERDGRI